MPKGSFSFSLKKIYFLAIFKAHNLKIIDFGKGSLSLQKT